MRKGLPIAAMLQVYQNHLFDWLTTHPTKNKQLTCYQKKIVTKNISYGRSLELQMSRSFWGT
jgi:hypothetical protein